MNGNLLIEKLLYYASQNLELETSDIYVKRNLLLWIFKLPSAKTSTVVSEVPTYKEVNAQLIGYIKENKLSDQPLAFADFIWGLLMPLPSSVNKRFRRLREKFGADAACEYLIGISQKSGRLSKSLTPPTTLYYKGDFASLSIFDEAYNNDVPAQDLVCPNCPDSEGFHGSDQSFCGAKRGVIITLDRADWYMTYSHPTLLKEQSFVCLKEHGKSLSVASYIMAMLDFIEYLPKYSAIASFSGLSQDNFNNHSGFSGGIFTPSYSDKKPDFTVTNELYPDVEISIYNGFLSAVRLQSFNRNTLENCAIDIAEKWQNYTDLSAKITGVTGDGVSHNDTSLFIGYFHDNRYIIDIVLTCKKEGDNGSDLSPYLQSNETLAFGDVVCTQKLTSLTGMITAVLTKKIPLDDSLFLPSGALYGFNNTVTELLSQYGYFKDEKKADAAVKQRLYKDFTDTLAVNSAFSHDDDGVRAFRKFLATLNIR